MDLYKRWPVQWSILTLSVQLVYCASVNSNFGHSLRQPHQLQYAAGSGNIVAEPMCSDQFVHEHEVRSSLTLDLHPSAAVPGPCKTVLTAPDSNVFIVRLHRTRAARPRVGLPSMMTAGNGGGGVGGLRLNATRSCPLSIISTSDPLKTPWKIDPCMLEDVSAGMAVSHDDPVQMLPGRLRIIWHHGGNAPNYRLIITALGKGQNCLRAGTHACLRFGSEIMLCISDALVCDGIRHCPTGNGYDSDEDPEMCLRFKANQPTQAPPTEYGLWQQISNELKKIIPSSSTETTVEDEPPTAAVTAAGTTTAQAKPTVPHRTTTTSTNNAQDSAVQRSKEARDRATLTRGLARYGPWGYLMLGMLLCGGALLMCGMWECCCRTKKPDPNGDDPVIVSTQSTDATLATRHDDTTATEPPNYDEIDPPPSYAALFPNQKSESTSGTAAATSTEASATTASTATATAAPASSSQLSSHTTHPPSTTNASNATLTTTAVTATTIPH